MWHTLLLMNQAGPPTLRQGLADTSKEALKARRCCVVKMVRGRFERLCSLLSSPPFPPPDPPPPSSSSLFTEQGKQTRKQSVEPAGYVLHLAYKLQIASANSCTSPEKEG